MRLQVIDALLSGPGQRRITTREMAAEINRLLPVDDRVSLRTIQMDVDHLRTGRLRELVPLKEDREGRHHYYSYTDPDFSLRQLPLSAEEAYRLDLALEALSREEIFPDVERLRLKLKKAGTPLSGMQLPSMPGKLRFEGQMPNPIQAGMPARWLQRLAQAIGRGQPLMVGYKGIGHEPAVNYTLHPYELREHQGRWFACGLAEGNPELPTCLALDRVEALKIDLERRYQPNPFPANFFDNVVGVSVPLGHACEDIELWVSEERIPWLTLRPLHQSQKPPELQSDGRFLVSMCLIPTDELVLQLLSHGPGVVVKSPSHLRDAVAEKARAILALNEG